MTGLATIDPTGIEYASDPGKFVELACERAKEWLAQALEQGDIDGIVELKSQAEAIRTYTAQKQLGKDAELSAAEIVRRAERGLGIAVKRGQEEGTVGAPIGRPRKVGVDDTDFPAIRPSDIFTGYERVESYAMAAASDEEFEQALEEAKTENNLSRANVVRKVRKKAPPAGENDGDKNRVAKARRMADQGYTTRQIAEAIGVKGMSAFKARHNIEVPADAVVGKRRHLDSNRVVNEVVAGADALTAGLYLVEWDDLDRDQIEDWVNSLSNSLRLLNRFRKQLKEKTQ